MLTNVGLLSWNAYSSNYKQILQSRSSFHSIFHSAILSILVLTNKAISSLMSMASLALEYTSFACFNMVSLFSLPDS